MYQPLQVGIPLSMAHSRRGVLLDTPQKHIYQPRARANNSPDQFVLEDLGRPLSACHLIALEYSSSS
jgi:hypothetical protein